MRKQRIHKVLASIAVFALGLYCCRVGYRIGIDADPAEDGTCVGLAQLFWYALSMPVFIGGFLSPFVRYNRALDRPALSSARGLDLGLAPKVPGSRHVNRVVEALFGLDQKAADKLVESRGVLRGGLSCAEAHYLQSRFNDFGIKTWVRPSSP